MIKQSMPVPTSSQTVGPYFHIGLSYLMERAPELEAASRIEIRGRVLDRDGGAVPDAVLEFWAADIRASTGDLFPGRFRRAATDSDGQFMVTMARPEALALEDGRFQSPHLLVLVFARGLLRHLLTRVYFEHGNTADPVLMQVPAERRGTLMAQLVDEAKHSYEWNVVLQGPDETVFFAW